MEVPRGALGGQAGARARWAPSALQLADGLTKSEASAHDTLRAVLRSGRYQLKDGQAALQQRSDERVRPEALGRRRADGGRKSKTKHTAETAANI